MRLTDLPQPLLIKEGSQIVNPTFIRGDAVGRGVAHLPQ